MTTGEFETQGQWPRELTLDAELGPAAHITRSKADAMIEAALLEAGFGGALSDVAGAPVPPAQVDQPRSKRRGIVWQVAAAAGLCFVGLGSASAAVVIWQRMVEPTPVVTSLPVASKPARAARIRQNPAPPEVQPIVGAVPAAKEEVEPSAERRKPGNRAPEDYLNDANQLRAEKKWRRADKSYERVWQTAPRSSAAYVARVASASVQLEHLHDPRAALARYRAAMEQSPRGALREEVRFGIAEAYRALGESADEKRALKAFLDAHPGSGLANKARARLAELGAP